MLEAYQDQDQYEIICALKVSRQKCLATVSKCMVCESLDNKAQSIIIWAKVIVSRELSLFRTICINVGCDQKRPVE